MAKSKTLKLTHESTGASWNGIYVD